MSDSPLPDKKRGRIELRDPILKNYFSLIHKIISRGITVSLNGARDFIEGILSDDETWQGYMNYVRITSLMLDTHHRTEDEIAFPYFQERLPETHFKWLFEDHSLITGFLEELAPMMDSLENEEPTQAKLEQLNAVLLKIEDRWDQHMELEGEEFVDQIDSWAPYEARKSLIDRFFEYNDKIIEPHDLSIPYMLHNLDTADRENWSAGFSNELLQLVETDDWKARWESMLPFLIR